jgi:pimeloyl-ACP methyl ester carboxylesterase
VAVDWERVESGPAGADRTVLLLPGGMCAARSYTELMAEPVLAGVRLVAVTVPGNAGAPPPDDISFEAVARSAAELAGEIGADAVVGFSMGATVALEMVASDAFSGPTVLLGISLSLDDEPAFLRVLDRLAVVMGRLPFSVMRQASTSLVKNVHVSEARKAELRDDLRRNDARVMRRLFHVYLQYLARTDDPAARLCGAGVPAWVVHAEKGDGDLTDDERRTLEACATVGVVTIPGESFMLPNDESARIAEIVVEALGRV